MDTVFIHDIIISGTHGANEQERQNPQRFVVSVKFQIDTTKAVQSDNLTDTVDYAHARDIVQEVIEDDSHNLIETLAEIIARRVLEDPRVRSVTVTIKKPEVFDSGIPGITITRENT